MPDPRLKQRFAPIVVRVLSACLVVGSLAASTASAATVTTSGGEDSNDPTFVAGSGETNDLRIGPGPSGSVLFTDPGAIISAGSGCVRVIDHQARCNAGASPSARASLGDGDDKLTADATRSVLASGDAGNDQLTGGPAADGLWGGEGDDVLDGRGGGDFMSGQGGADRATYADRTAAAAVNLRELVLGTEGEAGERDTVASDIERVTGGQGGDTLIGGGAADQLDGGPGPDRLDGGGGADDLKGGPGADAIRSQDATADKVNCGATPTQSTPTRLTTSRSARRPPQSHRSSPRLQHRRRASPPHRPVHVRPRHRQGAAQPGAPERKRAAHAHRQLSRGRPRREVRRCHDARARRRPARAPQRERGGRPPSARACAHRRRHLLRYKAGRKGSVRVRVASVERRRLARRGSERVHVYLRTSKRRTKSRRPAPSWPRPRAAPGGARRARPPPDAGSEAGCRWRDARGLSWECAPLASPA